jgi:hypothetical protein
LTWTTHGVTQAVGLSRPETSAVAPGGVDAMEMLSVVPRVADAQPRHGVTIAAANNSLMIIDLSPRCDLSAKSRGCSRISSGEG